MSSVIQCFSGRGCFSDTAVWRNTVFFGAVERPDVERPDRVIFGAAGYGIFQHGRMVNTAFFRTGGGIRRFFRCGWTAGYDAFPHGRVIQRFPA